MCAWKVNNYCKYLLVHDDKKKMGLNLEFKYVRYG